VNSPPGLLVPNSGAAYIFQRSGSAWSQQAYVKAFNTDASDYFGWSVGISSDTVVVGAPGEDSGATGINGGSDETTSSAGAAYVFVRSGGNWSQQAFLKAGNAGYEDSFGYSVAVSGDIVIAGAPLEASSSTGSNSQANEDAPGAGAAYVFVRNAGLWSQEAYLKAHNPGMADQFGRSVAASGNLVAAGAPGEDSSLGGVNRVPNDDAASAGAAYVFLRGAATEWTQRAYLKAGNAGANDNFGHSVALSADTLLAGAPGEDSITTGINSTPADGGLLVEDFGAGYVFTGLVPATGPDI
jgi:hypothetical protein